MDQIKSRDANEPKEVNLIDWNTEIGFHESFNRILVPLPIMFLSITDLWFTLLVFLVSKFLLKLKLF